MFKQNLTNFFLQRIFQFLLQNSKSELLELQNLHSSLKEPEFQGILHIHLSGDSTAE